MITKIQSWGNSQGIRIPKSVLEESGISTNEDLEIVIDNGAIVLKKAKKKHTTLKERLEGFYGTNLENVTLTEQQNELDWGRPEGEEIW